MRLLVSTDSALTSLLAHVMLRTIIGQPGNSSIVCRVQLRQISIQLSEMAGFDVVGHHLGTGQFLLDAKSFYRSCSDLDWYGNSSAKTITN